MIRTATLFFCATVTACLAQAGPRDVGNGGDVYICQQEPPLKDRVELLDYYEARIELSPIGAPASAPPGLTIDLGGDQGGENADVLRMVDVALERLARFHPVTAEILRKRAEGFFDDTIIRDDIQIHQIDDSFEIFKPVGCELHQAAAQKRKELPTQKTFVIDKRIWDQMTPTHRAGLVLHELIYERMLTVDPRNAGLSGIYSLQQDTFTWKQYYSKAWMLSPGTSGGDPKSVFVRNLNAYISSREYEQISMKDWFATSRAIWFLKDLKWNGVNFSELEFVNDEFAFGRVHDSGDFEFRMVDATLLTEPGDVVFFSGDLADPISGNEQTFDPENIAIAGLFFNRPRILPIPGGELHLDSRAFVDLSHEGVVASVLTGAKDSFERNENNFTIIESQRVNLGNRSYFDVDEHGVMTSRPGAR